MSDYLEVDDHPNDIFAALNHVRHIGAIIHVEVMSITSCAVTVVGVCHHLHKTVTLTEKSYDYASHKILRKFGDCGG
jgi:hypothetical protein